MNSNPYNFPVLHRSGLALYVLEVVYAIPCPWRSLINGEVRILSCRPWGEKGSSVLLKLKGSIDQEKIAGKNLHITSMYRLRDGQSLVILRTNSCPCRISGLNEMHIISSRIDAGIIKVRMICENKSEAKNLLSRMRASGIRIISAKLRTIREEDILTPRQEEALILGFIKGYFDNPRRIDLGALSKELGVSKPTTYSMIKRAIRKLIRQTLYI